MHTLLPYTRNDGVIVYRVGFYDPNPRKDNWRVLGETEDQDIATQWVNYLNGGAGKPIGPLNGF